jgi:DNA polymerase III alpha subunit
MTTLNKFGEPVFSERDLVDLAMSDVNILQSRYEFVVADFDASQTNRDLQDLGLPILPSRSRDLSMTVHEFDRLNQQQWFMPQEYQDLDIAAHVLSLCRSQEQLQRVGQELLLFQERELFDLLKYLKYLVDVMQQNHIIWGVGRGSSVASYVLFLLGVHRVDSMFYDLDPREFLR